jgi:hypothetical protein
MGHPGFVPGLKKARATADPCGMTNKETGNGNCKGEIRGFFASLRMTVILSTPVMMKML